MEKRRQMSFAKAKTACLMYKDLFDQASQHCIPVILISSPFQIISKKIRSGDINKVYSSHTNCVVFPEIVYFQFTEVNTKYTFLYKRFSGRIIKTKTRTDTLFNYFSFFIAIHRGWDKVIVFPFLRHSRHLLTSLKSRSHRRKSP